MVKDNLSFNWLACLASIAFGGCDVDSIDPDLPNSAPQAVAIDARVGALAVCARAQLTAFTIPRVEGALFLWRSSDPTVLSVDSRGRVSGNAPGTAIIVAQWAQDTVLQASLGLTVASIGPGLVSLTGFRDAESGISVEPSHLRSRIDVLAHVFVNAYTIGDIELLVDDGVHARAAYPTGCPQRNETVTLALDTRSLVNGPHRFEVRVVSERHVVFRDIRTVTVDNRDEAPGT